METFLSKNQSIKIYGMKGISVCADGINAQYFDGHVGQNYFKSWTLFSGGYFLFDIIVELSFQL